VLGEMLELGEDSATEHADLGAEVARLGVDLLVAVGAGTGPLAAGARTAGAGSADTTEVVEVADVAAAADLLTTRLRAGDVVLLKGSNGSGIWRLADELLGAGSATEGRMPS
jgi:UDP-N-acetylmuramoyl-tripeptide--D-alanyl-D-alanine ligase